MKSFSFQPLREIKFGSADIDKTSTIQYDLHAAEIENTIAFLPGGIPAEIVCQARTSARDDRYPQHCVVQINFFFARDLVDSRDGSICELNVFHFHLSRDLQAALCPS